ncbi:MAG: YraN family protein [Candidatus Cloacimonetes bacterium]|nr:YraN family protein [Candidatus Cloacimonadota bacterium]
MGLANNYSLGILGESLATRYLISQGYQIVARNFHTQYGELDCIARKNDELVFLEIKTRSNFQSGTESAVSRRKQLKMSRTALVFLASYPQYDNMLTRFDIIIIHTCKGNIRIEHTPDAFFPDASCFP